MGSTGELDEGLVLANGLVAPVDGALTRVVGERALAAGLDEAVLARVGAKGCEERGSQGGSVAIVTRTRCERRVHSPDVPWMHFCVART